MPLMVVTVAIVSPGWDPPACLPCFLRAVICLPYSCLARITASPGSSSRNHLLLAHLHRRRLMSSSPGAARAPSAQARISAARGHVLAQKEDGACCRGGAPAEAAPHADHSGGGRARGVPEERPEGLPAATSPYPPLALAPWDRRVLSRRHGCMLGLWAGGQSERGG